MTHLEHLSARTLLGTRDALSHLRHRLDGQAGEGVISAAIVVLIMALLGVAMWVAFDQTMTGATDSVDDQISQLGN